MNIVRRNAIRKVPFANLAVFKLQEDCPSRIRETQSPHQHEGFDEVEPVLRRD